MTAHQVELQLHRVTRSDWHVREASKSSRNAVDRFSTSEALVDELTGALDAIEGRRRNDDARAVSYNLDRL